jgi:general secretion pathway protein D
VRFALNTSDRQRQRAKRLALACGVIALWPLAAMTQTSNASVQNGASEQLPAPAQSAPAGTPNATGNAQAQTDQTLTAQAEDIKEPTNSDKRRAAKVFLEGDKLFVEGRFDEAIERYTQAAELDGTNGNYKLSIEVARSHAVTALIQAAAKARLVGDEGTARADLQQALKLDPKSAEVTQHLYELGDDVVRSETQPLYGDTGNDLGAVPTLAPLSTTFSFHLHSDQVQVLRQVFNTYGIQPMFDSSVTGTPVRFDVDDATFAEAARLVGLATNTFFVPLDTHRVLIAKDTHQNRQQYERVEAETLYVPGLSEAQLTEVGTVAKNVFSVQTVSTDRAAGTITLRATPNTLTAFNTTIRTLLDGRNQVVLDVRLIQVAHSLTRNTGVQPPQSIQGFNIYAEEQSILNANQSLVQQIISSGLASANDIPAILAILLASGQISSSLFSNGFATFGGGKEYSAIAPGSFTMNLELNSSDSRELDQIQLRLGDGEDGTIKEGERYPIQTASFSSLSSGLGSIPGLTGAGSSSSLSSLLASASAVPNIPMVQYQDLGLTLKANPKVMRDGTVALTLDMKLDSLSGSSVNGNPILNSQAFSGVTTLKEGESSVVAAQLSRSQSLAISGTPGLSEIPGMNNLTSKDNQYNYATLVIVMTPHVVRGTQAAGHTPMIVVEKTQ